MGLLKRGHDEDDIEEVDGEVSEDLGIGNTKSGGIEEPKVENDQKIKICSKIGTLLEVFILILYDCIVLYDCIYVCV